jgi:hypothetical protein
MQVQRKGGRGIPGENIMRRLRMAGQVYPETVVYRGLLVEVSVALWS